MDIAAALEYAHRKNVIHRDIKPENVLIDRQGRGIVMDFGIAKAQDQTRRTAAGTFMGTARYVSPEQAMGKDIDGRSDLYSLGVTLYELAVGRAPFDSDNWMTVLYQHINEAPPPIDSLKADLDRDFQTILYRLLEKKPEDRLQNAKACHTALKRVFQNLGGTDYATEALDNIETRADPKPRFPQPSQPATPPVRKRVLHPQQPSPEESSTPPHRRLAPVLALLSLFALAAVAFWLWPEGTTPPPPTFPTHVTAFPSGDLVSLISDQQGAIPLIKSKLPLLLDLPEGTYTATWRFGNDTLERTVVVRSGTINTWHMNFVAFSSEQFLLEDLQ
jgi:serine/threonine-protein kinase